jgi:hypothetical protein
MPRLVRTIPSPASQPPALACSAARM